MLYPHIVLYMAEVIVIRYVEDVKPHNCMLQHVILADVITKWQMEWPLQGGFNYQLADVITKWQMEQP